MSPTDGRASAGRGDLVVFDVCDTLYRENTTMGFLDAFHRGRAGSRRYARLKAMLTSRRSPLAYAAAASLKWLRWDWARILLIGTLAGYSRDALQAAADRYVADALSNKGNAAVLAALEEHRRSGDRIVLVSSSLDVVVEQIAAALNCEWHASVLGFDTAGRCTGRLVRDLTGMKHRLVQSLRRKGEPLHVYTDNLSDRALVEAAAHRHVVVPPGRSRKGWSGTRADFIQL